METKEIKVKQVEAKKEQKISVSYTLKAFAKNCVKLKKLGYLNDSDFKTLTEIKNKMIEKYLKNEF